MSNFDEKLLEHLCRLTDEVHFTHTAITTSFEWCKSHANLATKTDLEQMEKRLTDILVNAPVTPATESAVKRAQSALNKLDALVPDRK